MDCDGGADGNNDGNNDGGGDIDVDGNCADDGGDVVFGLCGVGGNGIDSGYYLSSGSCCGGSHCEAILTTILVFVVCGGWYKKQDRWLSVCNIFVSGSQTPPANWDPFLTVLIFKYKPGT